MSSHHIIREKQEPALYIHKLGNFDEEYLGQLLEWSPTLIVSQEDYEKVLSLGLKVDMVVTDQEGFALQEHTKVILARKELLDAVLDYLIDEGYSAVNVIDEKSNLRDLGAYIDAITIVVFTETEKAYSIQSGFKIWKPAGSVFYIEVVSYFEAGNLQQIENAHFEVVEDGFVDFTFNTPYLFISEKL